jgi:hypothetical protein
MMTIIQICLLEPEIYGSPNGETGNRYDVASDAEPQVETLELLVYGVLRGHA